MTECQDPRNSAPWVCGKCGPCRAAQLRDLADDADLTTLERAALLGAVKHLTSLEAEKERLRETLTEIAEHPEHCPAHRVQAHFASHVRLARQSLNHHESTKETG